MKKVLLLAAALLGMATAASAQTFENGSKVVNLGVGIGSSYGFPVSVSYEQGIMDIGSDQSIGVGGYVGMGFDSDDYTYVTYNYTNIFLAAAGNYHYTGVDKFDFYAGIRLGYNVASANANWIDADDEDLYGDLYSASAGGFIYTAHVGARYYFNDSFAANAELGYGIAYLNVGVSYKF